MISKEKFLEAAKTCLEDRIAEFAWGDREWQKYLEDNAYEDSDAESAALTATGIFIPFDSVAEARKTIRRDSEWLAEEDEEDEENRRYGDFEDYLSQNYVIHEFPDGSVVVKDLFGFELRG